MRRAANTRLATSLVTSHGLDACKGYLNSPPAPRPSRGPSGDRTVDESRTSPSPRTRPGRCRVSRRKAAQPDPSLGFRGRPSLWTNRSLGRLQSAPQVPNWQLTTVSRSSELRDNSLHDSLTRKSHRYITYTVLTTLYGVRTGAGTQNQGEQLTRTVKPSTIPPM